MTVGKLVQEREKSIVLIHNIIKDVFILYDPSNLEENYLFVAKIYIKISMNL
jgi:hypothetical protein